MDQGQRLAARAVGIDQRRDAGGRVYLQIVRLLLVALRQVENVHRAPDAAFVNRDRCALPVAGTGCVEFHGCPLVSLVILNRAIIRVATREREVCLDRGNTDHGLQFLEA